VSRWPFGRQDTRRDEAGAGPAGPTTVAMCGAGMVATVHSMAAAELGWRVVAVASRTAERAGGLATRCGARVVGYDELPAGADIVVVATPPAQHVSDALAALARGAAVVVEKPLCRTLEEADRLVAAEDGRVLYGENLAAAPVVLELLRRARQLGPLELIEVRALQGLPTWGGFTTDEWGGGALFDLGAHPLAVALLLAGSDPVVSVQATLRSGPGHASDEHAEVALRFRSGLTARVVASWQAGPDPVWDAQVSSATGVVRAELLPEPALEVGGDPVGLAPSTTPTVPILDAGGYLGQLAVFADDLRRGRAPLLGARFGRHVLELTCAAYASAGRGGDPVSVPWDGPRDRTPLQLWHFPPL